VEVRCLPGVACRRASYSMPRFPSPGSSRVEFPGFLGTIKALRLPAVLPAALRFLRLAVPRDHAYFAPAATACRSVGPGVVPRYPHPGMLPWRRQDLPSSWGTSIPVCTCSQTPAGPCVPITACGTSGVAPALRTTKAPTIRTISRLNSMAFGLAVYASRCRLPFIAQDSLPGAGQALLDGLLPARPQYKVSNHSIFLLIQASWRNLGRPYSGSTFVLLASYSCPARFLLASCVRSTCEKSGKRGRNRELETHKTFFNGRLPICTSEQRALHVGGAWLHEINWLQPPLRATAHCADHPY
jgi:hypothetical protein